MNNIVQSSIPSWKERELDSFLYSNLLRGEYIMNCSGRLSVARQTEERGERKRLRAVEKSLGPFSPRAL